MGTRVLQFLMFFLLGFFLCAGSTVTETPLNIGSTWHIKELEHHEVATKRDVITPITTVPMANPTPIPSTTIASPPAMTNPVTPPTTLTPTITSPTTTTPATTGGGIPASTGGSWCLATQSASETALQVALDYACGFGGADCSAIQSSGPCYNPNTVRDHASYAFNNYFQKNPNPNSCNFGGTAVITNVDPSNGSCAYPSTSTSASVLNTTNPIGSTVYGAEPNGSNNSAASCVSHGLLKFFTMSSILVSVLAVRWI
ncbi:PLASMODESMATA CALLOSE-BINDING PROTEIN 5-like [Macadamia integrifolia]|uniref:PLASMODESMATA CALLOSE-BINDING PROTEIN 5-like n=1 Tax=Macadamia integrifolia TaxID=60698 RepID=UPI001C4FC415|nr:PLASMODESMATA CALLOSE-BINDING PROTEIN 5-like [Macadamia integrifolia]